MTRSLWLVLLLLAPAAEAAVTRVAGTGGACVGGAPSLNAGSCGASTMSVNYTPTTTNNAITLMVGCSASTGTPTVTATASGWTLTQQGSVTGSTANGWIALFTAYAPSTSAATFSVTWSLSCTNLLDDLVNEWSGANTSSFVGTTTFLNYGVASGCTGLSTTPSANNSALVGHCFGAATSAGSGFTLGSVDGQSDASEYQVLTGGSGTPVSVVFGGTSGTAVQINIEILAASGGGGGGATAGTTSGRRRRGATYVALAPVVPSLTYDAIGDSITFGLAAQTTAWPQTTLMMWQASVSGSGSTVNNRGVSGYTTTQMLTSFSGGWRTDGSTLYTLMGGINDIRNNATSTTIANLESILGSVKTDGHSAISMTTAPCGTLTAPQLTTQTTFNATLQSYAVANGIPSVDIYTLLADTTTTTSRMAAAYDSGDQLHPNQVGNDTIALAARAALLGPAKQTWAFDRNYNAFPEDASTVLHCKGSDYNGTTLNCSIGGAWTTNGTIAQSASSSLYTSFGGSAAKDMGGNFSDSNYFSLGTGSDVLDSLVSGTSTFQVCLTFTPVSGNNGMMLSDGTTTAGILIAANSTTAVQYWAGTGNKVSSATQVLTTTGHNVQCFGRGILGIPINSTQIFAMSINATNITPYGLFVDGFPGSTVASGTGATLELGRYSQNTGFGYTGRIYEVYASSHSGEDYSLYQLAARALGETSTENGIPISVTRQSLATYVINSGTRYSVGSGVGRINENGLIVEPASTNYFFNDTAPVTQTTPSLPTGAYTSWVEGSGSLALTLGSATATGIPCTATAASPCTFTVTGAGTVVATNTGTLTEAQIQTGSFKTSAIITASATATRVQEVVDTTALMLGPLSGTSTPSWSADVIVSSTSTAANWLQVFNSTTDRWTASIDTGGHAVCAYYNGTTYTATSAATLAQGVSAHVRCYYDGTNIAACIGGVCTTAASSFAASSIYFHGYLGYDQPTATTYAVQLKNLCLAPTSSGCN